MLFQSDILFNILYQYVPMKAENNYTSKHQTSKWLLLSALTSEKLQLQGGAYQSQFLVSNTTYFFYLLMCFYYSTNTLNKSRTHPLCRTALVGHHNYSARQLTHLLVNLKNNHSHHTLLQHIMGQYFQKRRQAISYFLGWSSQHSIGYN